MKRNGMHGCWNSIEIVERINLFINSRVSGWAKIKDFYTKKDIKGNKNIKNLNQLAWFNIY